MIAEAIDPDRLHAAYQRARDCLLAEREPAGHWVGELANSALSTATACGALALVKRASTAFESSSRGSLDALVRRGLEWLAAHQNPDGGWGDTDKSHSNIATTMLTVAAFHLADQAQNHAQIIAPADRYIDAQGRIAGLRRRYGRDKTFAAPILATCAMAGLVPWREVNQLPFELACVPQTLYRYLQLPVVSYAVPALVAIGQVRFAHAKPWNPVLRALRFVAREKSLNVLRRMQPESGGYLEAIPLTSFVVMSLAEIGHVDHPVTRSGARFLIDSVRADGSWPIDTNLATWNTTLAVNALAHAGEDVAALGCLNWLLACQHRERHPFTGAAPGGWGWSDLSGAVPDADDTPGALLALAHWYEAPSCEAADRRRISQAAADGLRWLLGLQNRDGGWPTFCRGWTKLPFDRSGADLTAHALRAVRRWEELSRRNDGEDLRRGLRACAISHQRLQQAMRSGLQYLAHTQRTDGSWLPLWFGNQDTADEENPIYGTSRVLVALRALGQSGSTLAERARRFLAAAQNEDGGWGSTADRGTSLVSSVEETALAVEALVSADMSSESQVGVFKGLDWLIEAVEADRHRRTAPIGFYFAKLWYYEKLYPQIFTVSALGKAARILDPVEKPTRLPPTIEHPGPTSR